MIILIFCHLYFKLLDLSMQVGDISVILLVLQVMLIGSFSGLVTLGNDCSLELTSSDFGNVEGFLMLISDWWNILKFIFNLIQGSDWNL